MEDTMSYFHTLCMIIIAIVGKLCTCLIAGICFVTKYFKVAGLAKSKQRYENNKTDYDDLLYENTCLRNELMKYRQANAINVQRLNNIAKKHSCLCERLKIVIFRLTHQIPGKELADLFGYSRRTITVWLSTFKRFGLLGLIPRGQLPWSSKFKTPVEIVQLVWKIHKDNPSWGRWKIAQSIWLLAVFISPSTVRNILKHPRPRWFRRRGKPKLPDIDNHTRRIKTTRTNQIWSIDLCAMMTGPYQTNILAILDHFSRKILYMTTFFGEPPDEWIINNLRSTFAEYGTPRAVITDHGGQFESIIFKRFLKICHVEHRQGRVGFPYSNGKIERFFLSLQKEVLNYYPILTYRKMVKLLPEYKIYYNQYRPHQSLDGAAPDYIYANNSLCYKIPEKIQKRISGNVNTVTFCDGLLKAYSLIVE